MSRHVDAALGALALTVLLLLAGVPAAGQRFTPPRTPWGDPDLQGDYSNKYEQGTPFERPAEFDGRRIEDITGAELAALVRERASEVLLNAPFTGGDPIAGNFGGAPAFYDRFEADKGVGRGSSSIRQMGKYRRCRPRGGRRQRRARPPGRRSDAGAGQPTRSEDRSLYDRCITRGLPASMMPTNYGNSYRIVQGPGYVAITYEMVHETRIIPLDGRAPLAPSIRQYMGEARGRWEGDTLVVETTNFKDEPAYRGANPETLRLIERFTAISRDKVEWSVTVDDPTTWTRRWTFAMPLTRNDKEAVVEYHMPRGKSGDGARAGRRASRRAIARWPHGQGSSRPARGAPTHGARRRAQPLIGDHGDVDRCDSGGPRWRPGEFRRVLCGNAARDLRDGDRSGCRHEYRHRESDPDRDL